MNNIQETIDKLELFNKLNPEIPIHCISCAKYDFGECLNIIKYNSIVIYNLNGFIGKICKMWDYNKLYKKDSFEIKYQYDNFIK